MHTVQREVQSSRYRVLCHHVFDASAQPEVRKHKNTTCQSVWESEGRELSGDLGENREGTILIKREFGIITLCNKPAFIDDVNIE